VTYLVALDVIHATLGLALGFVAALLVFDGSGGGSSRRCSTASDS
jgi:hypothetical protein